MDEPILGTSGKGQAFYMKDVHFPPEGEQVIILDPEAEYQELCKNRPPRSGMSYEWLSKPLQSSSMIITDAMIVQKLLHSPLEDVICIDNSDGEYTQLMNTFPGKIVDIAPNLKSKNL